MERVGDVYEKRSEECADVWAHGWVKMQVRVDRF